MMYIEKNKLIKHYHLQLYTVRNIYFIYFFIYNNNIVMVLRVKRIIYNIRI